MPGLPIGVHESSHSRSVDEMCHLESLAWPSSQDTTAAEDDISVYCKPVELYNIIKRRALYNPSYIQRCLHHNIEARRNKRIQINIWPEIDARNEENDLFPLNVLLVKSVSGSHLEEFAMYRLQRRCVLSDCSVNGKSNGKVASFIIPELRKICTASKPDVSILLLKCGEGCDSIIESEETRTGPHLFRVSGPCYWGILPLESLYYSWSKSASFTLGNVTDEQVVVEMQSSHVEAGGLDVENCILFQKQPSSENVDSKKVCVNIFAQEIFGKERSPYKSHLHNGLPTSSLSRIRLKTGNVIFNYRYCNNLRHTTEFTEDFSCPFCLARCGSFKGLRFHLTCSHDLFKFEFWVTEDYQAVNVSVKTELMRSEIVSNGVDPKLQTFFFMSKPRKRKRLNDEGIDRKRSSIHITRLGSPEILRGVFPGNNAGSSDSPMPVFLSTDYSPRNGEKAVSLLIGRSKSDNSVLGRIPPVASCSNANGACAVADLGNLRVDCDQLASDYRLLPCAKTRKLSADRSDQDSRALLKKRQFFHSHKAQPMAMEQVLSDHDSEDEVDDDIADFEDRRMLDDFVDVTKDEKNLMHLWNSFVRKQRVLADGHVPWACEAFSKLHGRLLNQTPTLLWCWRLFMVKLWNHSLLDARTLNNCNITLESFKKIEAEDASL